MKKILTLATFFLMVASTFAAGRAKYVFYFIGDGMGVNQVNGTETYLAALEGRIGVTPILFGSFPVAGLVTTYSGTNGVTDSAAAGTALATGHKTKNGSLGVLADGTTLIYSVAQWAKDAGAAVGVSTSVSVDHATPAAFYAHVASRSSYYHIGKDMLRAGYDFYGGSDFLQPEGQGDEKAEGTLYEQSAAAGYTIARGYTDFVGKNKKGRKMILLQPEAASARDRSSLPYAIDRTAEDMTLREVTRAGIQALTAQKKDGFFLMVEGGKIDWACHANDAATVFQEVLDMDEAVAEAYEFYKQHPDETLIVVTADHETGGIVLGRGPYELHTDLLQYQRMSAERYSAHLAELHAAKGTALTWDEVKADLTENWGFWSHITLTEQQEGRLRKAYDDMVAGTAKDEKSLYASLGGLASAARRTMAEVALIGWQSGGHSNGYVPVFAIGADAELFSGKYDNTEIPKRIAEATGWQMR